MTARLFTATERKAGARDAVAVLTASSTGDHHLVQQAGAQAFDQLLPIVTVSIVGLVSGLLESLNDEDQGVAERWLVAIGQGVEAMPEGGA